MEVKKGRDGRKGGEQEKDRGGGKERNGVVEGCESAQ